MLVSRKFLRLTAGSLVSLATLTAYAGQTQPAQLQRSAIVHFSDLNLQSSKDVARLYQRIALSADQLCGPRTLTGAYMKSADYASCHSEAVSQAVASINSPLLTSYHRQHQTGVLSVAER